MAKHTHLQGNARRPSGFSSRLAALLLLLPCSSMAAENVLRAADTTAIRPGLSLPDPWQTSAHSQGITLRGAQEEGWIEFRDESADFSANMRQTFPPVRNGRLTFQIRIAPSNLTPISFYLGVGSASSPGDRVIDMKTSKSGRLRIGNRGEREDTPLLFIPGSAPMHLFINWSQNDAGILTTSFGTMQPDGSERILHRGRFEDPREITTLRITTDNPDVGGHFFIGSPRLERFD